MSFSTRARIQFSLTKKILVAYENKRSLIHSSTEINFLIFSSSFSIVSLLYLEVAPRVSPRSKNYTPNLLRNLGSYQPVSSPLSIMIVQALVSFLYMAGFIALSVFLSKLLFCHGPVCGAARADAVFAAFSYAMWAASATISGIQISKSRKKGSKPVISDEKFLVVDKVWYCEERDERQERSAISAGWRNNKWLLWTYIWNLDNSMVLI